MSEKLICPICKKELGEEKVGEFCSMKCYQKAYRIKKKSNSDKAKELVEEMPSIIESIKGGLGQAIEMEELDRLRKENEELKAKLEEKEEILKPTFSEIEDKFSEQLNLSDDIIKAIYLLREHSQKSKDIQHLYNRQSELDKMRTDLEHILEFTNIKSPKETNELLIKFREVLVERRAIKNLISTYSALRKLEGFTTIDYSTIVLSDKKVYKPRILDCGTLTSDSQLNLSELNEKPKSIFDIVTEDHDEYIRLVNEMPLTSKMSLKSVDYVIGKTTDVKTKLMQLSQSKTPYRSFRISNGTIKCYL